MNGVVKIKRLFILFSVLLLISPAAAGGYNVSITSSTVTATALDSCGLSSYSYHTATFQNWCPFCHRTGCLRWNPKGVTEGEWTCRCGADFCAADGKCKSRNSNIFLKRYTIIKKFQPSSNESCIIGDGIEQELEIDLLFFLFINWGVEDVSLKFLRATKIGAIGN